MGTIIAVIADTHFGSTRSPAPPEYGLHISRPFETKTQTANKIQLDLLDKWKDYWQYVFNLAGIEGKNRKHRLVVIHMGDVKDGNHHETTQITPEADDQNAIAETMMGEAHNKADVRIGVIGTDAHAGPAGVNEWSFYQANNYQVIGNTLSIDIDGVLFDLAHHVTTGARKWTSGAARIAADIALDYAMAGKPLPHYVLRAHAHQVDDSGYRVRSTRAIICPPWQFRTSFGYKVSTTTLSDIGGLVFNSGGVDFTKARYTFASDKEIIRI